MLVFIPSPLPRCEQGWGAPAFLLQLHAGAESILDGPTPVPEIILEFPRLTIRKFTILLRGEEAVPC